MSQSTTVDEGRYSAENEPAFPNEKSEIQHSVYVLPEIWESVEGSTGLLWETEVLLRREEYHSLSKRELQTALFRAAAENLTSADVAVAFVELREERREDGPMLDTE